MRAIDEKFTPLLRSASNGSCGKRNFRHLKGMLVQAVQREVKAWKPYRSRDKNLLLPFQVIDFFCGCGGMSLGFAALSRVIPLVEIIGGCDINEDALSTFEKNFSAPGIKTDILELVDNDQALDHFLSMLSQYDKSRPTIVIGCAPCQGFTSHRKKHWHRDDHRNTLVGAFASIAVRLKPVCIVMENVPEMLSKKYWSHFCEAHSILTEAGYEISQTIYNAASFGVPQDRFRALVIAMRKPFLLPEPQIIDPARYKTVKDAIRKLPAVEPGEYYPGDVMHRSAGHRESTLETIRAIPKNGGSRPPGVGPKCLDRVRGFYDVYGRLAWDRPAITVTHYARNPASGRYVHPEQDRGLTMREAALLQSFPKGFVFEGSFDSIFKQIGEAVPPLFSAAVAASCVTELVSRIPNATEIKHSVDSVTEPVSSSFSSVIAGLKMVRNRK